MTRRQTHLAFLLIWFLAVSGRADTDAGRDAYLRKDWETALRELQAGAQDGDVEALFWLGDFYSAERGLYSKDPKQAFRYFKLAAERGHPTAALLLANAYATGKGVDVDDRQAIRWLRAAAGDGVSEAQRELGLRYSSGYGVPQDIAEAQRLLILADKRGDGLAKYRPDKVLTPSARKALADGNYEIAVQEFTKLAERGVASAQLNLGFLYFEGRGVPKDTAEAARWWKQAAEHDELAAYSLAHLYLQGVGVQKDPQRAVKLLQKAGGLSQAHYVLAAVYASGDLGQHDYKRAAEAVLTIPPNQFTDPPVEPRSDLDLVAHIPRVYSSTEAERLRWVQFAAEDGHLESQKSLGHLYELGSNTEFIDLGCAYFWYSLAADQGDALAEKVLARIAAKISDQDLSRARQMIEAWRNRSTRRR